MQVSKLLITTRKQPDGTAVHGEIQSVIQTQQNHQGAVPAFEIPIRRQATSVLPPRVVSELGVQLRTVPC